MESLPAMRYCPSCRESLIMRGSDFVCLNCEKPKRPKHIVKPPPVTENPSDKEFKHLTGAVIDSPKEMVKGKAGFVARVGSASDALEIMRNLPMPKNMQEFKQIQKIIKQLEKLVGEGAE